MDKPDLRKMWRTWVKIGPKGQLTPKMLQETIRYGMHHISQLRKKRKITWFCFLYHDKPDDPSNGYFDIVFTVDKGDPNEFLPEYCVDTRKISPMKEINGIDMSILKDKDIAEAWKIIGEQSEFIVDLVCAHTETGEIHLQQIAQFMHYFMNPLGLGNKSILFFPKIPPQIIWQIQVMPEEMKKNFLGF